MERNHKTITLNLDDAEIIADILSTRLFILKHMVQHYSERMDISTVRELYWESKCMLDAVLGFIQQVEMLKLKNNH